MNGPCNNETASALQGLWTTTTMVGPIMSTSNVEPGKTGADIFSQVTLARYREFMPLAGGYKQLFEHLYAAVDRGAVVEEGDLIVDFFVTSKKPSRQGRRSLPLNCRGMRASGRAAQDALDLG